MKREKRDTNEQTEMAEKPVSRGGCAVVVGTESRYDFTTATEWGQNSVTERDENNS